MNDLAKLAGLERDSEVGVGNSGESWTILRMILWSAEYLKNKGVETGRLDAEWLLAAALGGDRLQLYLKYARLLSSEEREAFKPLLRRRACKSLPSGESIHRQRRWWLSQSSGRKFSTLCGSMIFTL